MDAKGRQNLFMALTVLLCLAVLAAGVVLSVGYFTQGRNLRAVDMQKYAKVEMEDEVYTVSVDADAIVKDFHLPNPKNTTLDIERYPDVATVYSLTFLVTPREEGGWLIQTGSDRVDPAADLKKGGLKLVNTEWVWNESDMKTAYRAGLEYPRKLSMKKYVLCSKNSKGEYVLTVDHERMLRATGWDLPEDEATRKAHTGYKAVLSLGYYITPLTTGGFLVETTTNMVENVYSVLLENGVKLTDTKWVYTLSEVETLYDEQHQAASAPASNVTENEAPEVGALKAQSGQQALTSLYHVDQTPVRTAIREAKEQKYGTDFKSSEVIANYFIVAKSDSAAHRNVFRVVYRISDGEKKEYLVADAYDVRTDTTPSSAEVRLEAKGSAEDAVKIDDFAPDLYTVHTLTEGSMVYAEDGGATPFDANGLLFPGSLTERITEADVWNLAIPEDKTLLQLLGFGRYEILARCGDKFADTSVYTKFYSNYAWYQPKGSISFESVRQSFPVGAENIEFIKAMEKLIREG